MKPTKIIGIVIILAALYLGYIGINKVSDNTKEVKFLGLEINASNESGKEKGYLFLGGAILLLGVGAFTLKK